TLEPPQWRGGPRVVRVTRGSLPGLLMIQEYNRKIETNSI
ncbi:unnamed protein product, partial [Penicillium salamii]